MKVLDLACRAGHVFEGWFDSEDDYQGQRARGFLQCPVCGTVDVEKRLSAPRLNLGKAESPLAVEPDRPTDSKRAPDRSHLSPGDQARLLSVLRQMWQQSEDVGERFADEARRIHRGEADARGIRGQASAAEAVELLEEGIPLMPLPDLPMLKEPLQ